MTDEAPLLLDVTRLIWRRWADRQPTGIDRVCLAYLNRFRDQAQAVVQHRRIRRILDPQSSAALFDLLATPQAQFRREMIRRALRFGLRKGAKGGGRLYLNVGHTGLNEEGFRAWVRDADLRPVYLVHDLIPITHPQFCRAGEAEKHRERMRTVLQSASGIIGNSCETLHGLAAFAADLRLLNPPTVRALLGAEALARSCGKSTAEPPTFVIVGTIEARKNHLMLLHVWERLIRQLGDRAPRLLVIGQRGWECDEVLDLLDRSELLKPTVTEIGPCSDEALAKHLSGARALLFPSLAEGFGLPLVEALASGVPVIASDLPVFREIAGDVPDYVHPMDGPAWEQTILDYSADASSARTAQLKRIASYRPPSWDDHFTAVQAWLERL